MELAIIGYGKMGIEVEKIAIARGHNIRAIIDPEAEGATAKELTSESLEGIDACIDFTTPEAAFGNIEKIASIGKNLVMATTGWHDSIDKARGIVEKSGIGFIHASNFSIGVNAFYRIVESAAGIMDRLDEYDIYGLELHHNRKKDSPSGTAKSIGEILLQNIKRKKKLAFDKMDRAITAEELHFASVRSGNIPGTHVVGFESAADSIELKHTARNRQGFALGAVRAAEWLEGKKGFYSIDDFVNDAFGGD